MSDVLVVIGPAASPLKKQDLAAVGFGRRAASLAGGSCDVLLLGGKSEAEGVARRGVRRVFAASHPDLDVYTAEAYAAAIAGFLEERSYRLVASATSSASREVMPRVAALIDAPMASDVLGIDSLDDERAVFTRAVFVGNLLASVELSGSPSVATCRASEFEVPEESDGGEVEAVLLEGQLGHPGKRFRSSQEARSDRPDLGEAAIVVTAGRGTRGPEEGIPIVEELADALGAALGATRAVVDAEWLPNELQVGQTGKVVAPRLYVAVGVSGAIQHVAGMRNSKTIVAINKDSEAPIFEVADLGLVADLFDAVPRVTAEIRQLRRE
ncbi:MAG: electron transfer flavoprotein subunit alpha/FixB family protein [Planctomycetota bacterium]|nr:electron transfer flavoprotein subunit alpha/FixB family protein [Planctomycetota bacterium]